MNRTPGVERRQQQRSYCDLSAAIRILADDRRLDGRILDLADQGMALATSEPLEVEAAIAVMYKGVLILADVMYCTESAEGYRTGLRIDQALATSDFSVSDAENEIRALLQQPVTQPLVAAYAHA